MTDATRPASPAASATETAGNPPICAAHEAAEQLLHLARLVQGGATSASENRPALTPAQWTALRYFARANRFSRTPSAFSEFNATTRGTASQVVKSLIGMGLLQRSMNQADGRSALIDITPAGRACLQGDPMTTLGEAIAALPPPLRAALGQRISALTATLARRKNAPVFGNCRDCRHCDSAADNATWCHCTQTLLSASDMGALCVDFAPVARRA
ncbi:MAG: winged helix-turn-helix transcriptional regulator [Pararhodobacter sp.]|nr:winged helix-turn-helix transcriptional regulator [Pararhodobacter sp.]